MKYIVSILLSLIILISPFLVISQFSYTYDVLYSFTGIYNDYPKELVDKATQSFIDIIHSDGDMLVEYKGDALFKSQEIYHMYEVHDIFYKLKNVIILLFFIVLSYILIKKEYKVFKYQLFFNVIFVLFFGVLSVFFSKSFDAFHRLIFNNEYWLFTSKHYLTKILTLDFFLYFLLLGIGISFVISLGLYFLEKVIND